QALAEACRAEPTLNAWFDGASLSLKLHERLDLGIAVDTPDGLFVPVLRIVLGSTADGKGGGCQPGGRRPERAAHQVVEPDHR
ncbi:2-oxo acid dehydrogenase subunit E2, partial [Pseudomonas aeruginosa]